MTDISSIGTPTLRSRILSHVTKDASGCWLWTASTTRGGYAQVFVGLSGKLRVVRRVHRVLYELTRGPIQDGMDLDHLCRVRHCVNPDHLEPVTRSENLRRGIGGDIARDRQAAKTHCPRGHPYAGANLYTTPNGKRCCRECRRAATRRYQRRKKGNAA